MLVRPASEGIQISTPFPTSDDFAERAHELYGDGKYDEVVELLTDGLALYPNSPELHLGLAYAELAREQYAWARRSFENALALDSDNEDALAGFGEVLLKIGNPEAGLHCFELVVALGFSDDHDLMLQIGRALFRESLFDDARRFFKLVVDHHPESSEGWASLGYVQHRIGNESEGLAHLQRALELDSTHYEARIYLANALYDRGDYEAALRHFERTEPSQHLDELGLWRMVELKRSIYRLPYSDPEVVPWLDRMCEISESLDQDELVLAEIEAKLPDGTYRDPHQLDFFGAALAELDGMNRRVAAEPHRVRDSRGHTFTGTWEEIVYQMKRADPDGSDESLHGYMSRVSRRSRHETGVAIPASDAESFIRGSARAGLLKIIR